jgi:predicted amidophosphoribosyltransferase
MICTTIRKGTECSFMTAKGCAYNGGNCHEVIENCNGCNRSVQLDSGWYCSACPEPSTKWKHGDCNMATHVSKSDAGAKKAKLNPLKASKRGSR